MEQAQAIRKMNKRSLRVVGNLMETKLAPILTFWIAGFLFSGCVTRTEIDKSVLQAEQEKKAHLEHSYEKHLEALRSKSEMPGITPVSDPWHAEQSGVSIDFSVQPHEPLVNQLAELSVWIGTISSAPQPLQEAKIIFRASMPHSPGHIHFPEDKQATQSPLEPNRYNLNISFGMPGTWEIVTIVELTDGKTMEAIFPIRVRDK